MTGLQISIRCVTINIKQKRKEIMENSIFNQISLVVAVVAAVSIVMRLLRQPLIMGYIITGVIVGPSVLNLIKDQEVFASYSSLGITLLLFIIGLGLNASVIKSLGRVSLLTAVMLFFPLVAGVFFVCHLLGMPVATAVVLAVATFFSSTVIILKVLSDKKELSRLYGQIAIGVILIDDVVATIALVVLTTTQSADGASLLDIAALFGRAFALAIGLYVSGRYILPKVSRFFAQSQELLFAFAVAWGLIIATLFETAGLSHEVGALFAGVSLAGLPYATEMASKLKPLRDFFLVLFFVMLGENFTADSFTKYIWIALLISAIVMVVKPLLIMASLGIQKYTKLTSFKTAIHLSQISEFSIIFVALAAQKGVVAPDILSLIALIAIITIGASTYLMHYDDKLYKIFEPALRIFERKNAHEKKTDNTIYPIVMIGYHKGGYEFLKAFREMKKKYLVVDYDPDVIDHLEEQGIRHAYGDATDTEFLEEIDLQSAKLVVSTMTDPDSNLGLLRYIRKHSEDTSFICHASNYQQASDLYDNGASYVSLPHHIGSERISTYIKRHGINHRSLQSYRNRHLITIGRLATKS